MNKLMMPVMEALPPGTNLTTTLMVIDYVVCTTPISQGEEVEVLTVLLELSYLLRLDWHSVFDPSVVNLAIEGKTPPTNDSDPKVIGVLKTHKALCNKRAALYKENQPSICDMADSIRPMLHG